MQMAASGADARGRATRQLAELEPTGMPAEPDHTFSGPRFSSSDHRVRRGQTVRTTLQPPTRGAERAVADTVRPHCTGVVTSVMTTAPRVGAAVDDAARESASPSAATEPGTLAVFGVANYRRFAAGQSLSLIGSWTQAIAEGLLVWQVTHSSIILGFVAATRYVPVLIGTPYAGLTVDRHDKRHTLVLTSTVLGVTSLAMGAAVLTHVIAIWMAFLSAAVSGVMTALDNPARMAFIPELVGAPLLRRAITTNSIMANVGRAVGRPWPLRWCTFTVSAGVSCSTRSASAWSSSRCCGSTPPCCTRPASWGAPPGNYVKPSESHAPTATLPGR